jgi:hypothetical protein
MASRVPPMTLLFHAPWSHRRGPGRAARTAVRQLAALALVGGGERPTVPALLVAAATLLDTIRRSLALAVVCGIAGFLLGQALPV